MSDTVSEFMSLFKGLDRAYGLFEIIDERESDGKKLGKVKSVHGPVTSVLWELHLAGRQGLGIVPIQDDGTTYFGAIDIDVYSDLDHRAVLSKIDQANLPLIATRSKSGGLHVWIFLAEPIPAKTVRSKLQEAAALLGFGSSEIFPKQTELLGSRGDIGNWINMPYFGDQRWAVTLQSERVDPASFIASAKLKRVGLEALVATVSKVGVLRTYDFRDGPPCLQHLAAKGIPTGQRNKGLYNLGVYAKKAFPEDWQRRIEQYNSHYLRPPLSAGEVAELIRSVGRKDYQYTCRDSPCANHCNVSVCRTRKFGVGKNSGLPTILGLTKFNSVPPIWFADIDGGGRLELQTEDLQSQSRFQLACMEHLNSMPAALSQTGCQLIIQQLIDTVVVVAPPYEASPKGQFLEHLERYCSQRAQAVSLDEIRLGKPYLDGGFHYFTLAGLTQYLERNKFRQMTVAQVAACLKNTVGAEHRIIDIRGGPIGAWLVPEFGQGQGLKVPDELKKGAPF